jgi:hypothetical protein
MMTSAQWVGCVVFCASLLVLSATNAWAVRKAYAFGYVLLTVASGVGFLYSADLLKLIHL